MKFSFAWRKLNSFFTLTMLNLNNGLFEQSIVNLRDIKIKIWIGAANSIEHGCTDWPDSKLVPKPSTIRSKHKIYLHIIVWIVFLFCHMFQIKRLSSVLYLHRKSNTIVLMYVNLFFIKRIKASIIDSRKTIKYWHSAAHCYLDFNP